MAGVGDDWAGQVYLMGASGSCAYAGGWMLIKGLYQSGLIIYLMAVVLLAIFFALLPDQVDGLDADEDRR